ncbi:hypothetical protein SKC41_30230 [Mycobacterium sp. 050128]|uniref:hypothetical protein n=1 Tax=Mycobacterium sp. 050128 TaxID=3096112 RepID=UPI002EDA4B7D
MSALELRENAARLEYDGSTQAAAAWREANNVTGSLWADWIWRSPEGRAEALVRMAAADAHPQSDGTFVLAHHAVKAISHENLRNNTLLMLITTMITIGRTDLAERVLPDLHGKHERRAAISALMNYHIDSGQLDTALAFARLETTDFERRKLMRDVATAFATANRIHDALLVIDEATLDEFMATLSTALAAWSEPPSGAVLKSLQAAAHVAGWVRRRLANRPRGAVSGTGVRAQFWRGHDGSR